MEQNLNHDNNEMINFYETDFIKNKNLEDFEKNKYILDVIKTSYDIDNFIKLLDDYKHNKKYVKCYLNVLNFDLIWCNSDCYIHKNIHANKTINKYLQSRIDLFNLHVTQPPILFFDDIHNFIFKFDNGRHRYANLRDLGCIKIPVLIHNKIYKKNFEYIKSSNILFL